MAIFGDCHIGFDKACAQRPPVNSAIDKIHHVSISMLGTLCEKSLGQETAGMVSKGDAGAGAGGKGARDDPKGLVETTQLLEYAKN